MKKITDLANQTVAGSLSDKARKKRLDFFSSFCDELGSDLNVIDVGGTFYHWKNSQELLKKIRLTLVNVTYETEQLPENVFFVNCDARDLGRFSENEFDVAYSNSMIEHFKTFDEQKEIARGIRRIAKHYFVQTPNRNFPVEPHFLFPMFQFMPKPLKKSLVKNFSLGWYDKVNSEKEAEELVSSIRLLNENELTILFPEAAIYKEKFWGLNKSFIAYN